MKKSEVKYQDPQLEELKINNWKRYRTIDDRCLKKYNEDNKHFFMEVIIINEEFLGYNCIYRYGENEVKISCDILTGLWKLCSHNNYLKEEKEQLNKSLDFVNEYIRIDMGYTLAEQIQNILRYFDYYFSENIKIMSKRSSMENEELTSEDIYSYITDLPPPPPPTTIVTHPNRQHRLSNTKNSVRFMLPPLTISVDQRRVIESIRLHVQRKKKVFENICDLLKGTKVTMLEDLGFEFLRIYDGKFNYRKGHTFEMSFQDKTWFLTIEQIKYIDCQKGAIEPRSLLTLEYKNLHISVHT